MTDTTPLGLPTAGRSRDEQVHEPRLGTALSLARQGIPILPCNARTKQPLTSHGFKEATTDEAVIRDWWTRWPEAMIGTPTGKITELFVIDLDTKSDGLGHFAALCREHGNVPATRTSTTPSGGRHLFFRYPQGCFIGNSAGKLGPGIDVRGQGGYVILPPSKRHDGAAYRWDTSNGSLPVADAPAWLLNLVARPAPPGSTVTGANDSRVNWAKAALHDELKRVVNAQEGERNTALNHAAFALGQIVAGDALAHEEVRARLLAAAGAVGLPNAEAERTIKSGMTAGAREPRPRPTNVRAGRPDQREVTPPSEPLPLFPTLPSAETYPLDALGPVLSRPAQAIARMVQVPDAIAGQSVLAAASLAAQALADVRLTYGQRRPLSLFFVTVAASGDRKSTADNEALRPIREREKALKEVHEREYANWRIAHAAWAAEKRKIESKRNLDFTARKDALQGLGPEPEQPLLPMLTAPDPTVEGLARVWLEAPGSLGIFSTEGGQFFGGHGMSPDNKLKTAAALSAYWDGLGHRRIRAVDGYTDLTGRRLATHLMVQPDAAVAFLGDPVLRSQGLLSRCLVAAPETLAGTRLYQDPDQADLATIRDYSVRLSEILDTPWPLARGKRNELEPRELTLTQEAATALKLFGDHVERQCGLDGELAPVRDFAAKAAEHASRIAGVLSIIEDTQVQEIGSEAIACGIRLAEWYLVEALRLHGAIRADARLVRAQRLLDWIRRQAEPLVDLRTILRRGPMDLRTKDAAEPALNTLLAHGQILEVSNRPRTFRLAEDRPS